MANTYSCNDSGEKVCVKNWYGEHCNKFCNVTAVNKRCEEDGEIVCNRDWFGDNCTTFCDSSSGNYNCSNTGKNFVLRIGTEQTALITVTIPPRIISVTTKVEKFASKIGMVQIAQNFVTQLRIRTTVRRMVK